jgi:hypothetical protein
VKYKVTGIAEESDNPDCCYSDSIKRGFEIVIEQFVVAEEEADCADGNPYYRDDMCDHSALSQIQRTLR